MLKIVDQDVEEVKRVIAIFLLSLLRNGGQTVELPSCQVNLTQLTERLSIVWNKKNDNTRILQKIEVLEFLNRCGIDYFATSDISLITHSVPLFLSISMSQTRWWCPLFRMCDDGFAARDTTRDKTGRDTHTHVISGAVRGQVSNSNGENHRTADVDVHELTSPC